MSIAYHVYANDGAGGPVDYSTPIGSTPGLTFQPPALSPDGDYRFAVRAYDTVSGLEDANVDAVVRVVTDGTGADITNRPNAPTNLAVVATANGTASVSWTYNPNGQGAAPTSFEVYVNGSLDSSYPYSSGSATYSGSLSGLSDGVSYTIGVRAVNGTGASALVTATVTARTTGPAAVEGLAAGVVA